MLDCGAAGDLLELHVALAPCVIGYAEIGRALSERIGDLSNHPYREWITEYAGEGYQGVATAARKHLDELAARSMTEQRFAELVGIFGQASSLEADFWQMGLASQ
ncbi:multifunctional thiamine-phosphate pyrophosphorylase/synthase/phosphomethylpyrimidine kinase [compost metagenome]